MSSSVPSDVQAIQAVVARVVHTIDARSWNETSKLFADRVQTSYTSLFGGEVREQPASDLIESWRKVLTPVVTQRLLDPVDVSVSGASATALCHVRGYHHRKGLPGGDHWMVASHYVFELSRTSDDRRIHKLKLETLYRTRNTKLLQEAGR